MTAVTGLRLWNLVLRRGEPVQDSQRRANVVRGAGRDPFAPPPSLTKDELFTRARGYEADRRRLANDASGR